MDSATQAALDLSDANEVPLEESEVVQGPETLNDVVSEEEAEGEAEDMYNKSNYVIINYGPHADAMVSVNDTSMLAQLSNLQKKRSLLQTERSAQCAVMTWPSYPAAGYI